MHVPIVPVRGKILTALRMISWWTLFHASDAGARQPVTNSCWQRVRAGAKPTDGLNEKNPGAGGPWRTAARHPNEVAAAAIITPS